MCKDKITELISELDELKDMLIDKQIKNNKHNVGVALKKVKESIDLLLDAWEKL